MFEPYRGRSNFAVVRYHFEEDAANAIGWANASHEETTTSHRHEVTNGLLRTMQSMNRSGGRIDGKTAEHKKQRPPSLYNEYRKQETTGMPGPLMEKTNVGHLNPNYIALARRRARTHRACHRSVSSSSSESFCRSCMEVSSAKPTSAADCANGGVSGTLTDFEPRRMRQRATATPTTHYL